MENNISSNLLWCKNEGILHIFLTKVFFLKFELSEQIKAEWT